MTKRDVEADGPRFWIVHTNDTNIEEATHAAVNGELVPICDENEAGIIAYATCDEHADRIVRALQMLEGEL